MNADGQLNTNDLTGFNQFAYCNNNPVVLFDICGTYPTYTIGVQIGNKIKYYHNVPSFHFGYYGQIKSCEETKLTEDQKIVIAIVASEANTTGPMAREGVANVIMNRVGRREWSDYGTPGDICKHTGFDGYKDDNGNYDACYEYLSSRDYTNYHYEKIINQVLPIYYNQTYDITGGCQLFYTPASMIPEGAVPNWDFSALTEVFINGVDSYYEFRFFKYN